MNITENGDIEIIEGEGLNIPISEKADGVTVDISAAPRVFILGTLRIDTIADVSNATGRRIVVTPEQLKAVNYGGTDFGLFDEQGVVPVCLWNGKVLKVSDSGPMHLGEVTIDKTADGRKIEIQRTGIPGPGADVLGPIKEAAEAAAAMATASAATATDVIDDGIVTINGIVTAADTAIDAAVSDAIAELNAAIAEANSEAVLGVTTTSGSLSPTTGTAYNNNAFSVVDAASFGQAGTLTDLALFALKDGWVIPFVVTDTAGAGPVSIGAIGKPTRAVAGQIVRFPDFTPTVTANQHIGFYPDNNGMLAMTAGADGVGSWVVSPNNGQLPGAASTIATTTTTRLKFGWRVSTGALGEIGFNKAVATESDFALNAATALVGVNPPTIGTAATGAVNLSIIHRQPAGASGVITSASAWAGQQSVGFFFVARLVGGTTYEIVQVEQRVRTLPAALATFDDVDLPIEAGDFFGIWSSSTMRGASGGPGMMYVSGQPVKGATPTMILLTTTPQIGCTITPSVAAIDTRSRAADAALKDNISGGQVIEQGQLTDGTATIAGGNLAVVSAVEISHDGLMEEFSYWTGPNQSRGTLIISEKNALKQYTAVHTIAVPFAPNQRMTVNPNIFVKKGQRVQLHAVGAFQRYTATGGASVAWTTGMPTVNTAEAGGIAAWDLAVSWKIRTGVQARLENVASAANDNHGAIVPAPFEDLPVPIVKGTTTAIGYDGQSNADDFGATTVLTTVQPYTNVMASGGALVPLVSVSKERSRVTAANYASRLRLRDGAAPEVLAAFTSAVPGSSITGLLAATNWVAKFNEIKAVDATARCPIVNWVQGETDITANMAQATYKGHLETVFGSRQTAMRTATGDATANLFMVMMQPAFDLTKAGAGAGPVLAQLELAQTNGQYFLAGAPLYRCYAAGLDNADRVHLSSIGYKLQGAYFGKANAALLAGKKPKWLDPRRAEFENNIVTVYFDVPVKPMALDTDALGLVKDHGFRVTDGGTTVAISSIRVEDDRLVITCASAFAGVVKVRGALDYLSASLNAGNGASTSLRDSDPERISISGVNYQLFNTCPHFEITASSVAV